MIDKQFLLAGRATFTIANDKGDHYTFRVNKPDEDKPYFVGILTGPDNTSSYTYLGVLDPEQGQIRLTAKSKYNKDSMPAKVAQFAVNIMYGSQKLPDGYTLRHEGKCGRCGRRLTRPDSLERGVGSYCWERLR